MKVVENNNTGGGIADIDFQTESFAFEDDENKNTDNNNNNDGGANNANDISEYFKHYSPDAEPVDDDDAEPDMTNPDLVNLPEMDLDFVEAIVNDGNAVYEEQQHTNASSSPSMTASKSPVQIISNVEIEPRRLLPGATNFKNPDGTWNIALLRKKRAEATAEMERHTKNFNESAILGEKITAECLAIRQACEQQQIAAFQARPQLIVDYRQSSPHQQSFQNSPHQHSYQQSTTTQQVYHPQSTQQVYHPQSTHQNYHQSLQNYHQSPHNYQQSPPPEYHPSPHHNPYTYVATPITYAGPVTTAPQVISQFVPPLPSYPPPPAVPSDLLSSISLPPPPPPPPAQSPVHLVQSLGQSPGNYQAQVPSPSHVYQTVVQSPAQIYRSPVHSPGRVHQQFTAAQSPSHVLPPAPPVQSPVHVFTALPQPPPPAEPERKLQPKAIKPRVGMIPHKSMKNNVVVDDNTRSGKGSSVSIGARRLSGIGQGRKNIENGMPKPKRQKLDIDDDDEDDEPSTTPPAVSIYYFKKTSELCIDFFTFFRLPNARKQPLQRDKPNKLSDHDQQHQLLSTMAVIQVAVIAAIIIITTTVAHLLPRAVNVVVVEAIAVAVVVMMMMMIPHLQLPRQPLRKNPKNRRQQNHLARI